jgi:hypothetical protein
MRETIEFRIPEEHADRYLRPDEGIILGGSVRKYELEPSNPRFLQLGQFDVNLKLRDAHCSQLGFKGGVIRGAS